MKPFFIILFTFSFSLFTLCAIAQQSEYPDSGFTNKAEAKNLTINGLKEGKWVEYLRKYDNLREGAGYKPTWFHTHNFELNVYKMGKLIGTSRRYIDRKLFGVYHYKDGKRNGASVEYYNNGFIWEKDYFRDDKLDSEFISNYPDGKPREYELFKMGKCIMRKNYYENGKLASEGSYLDGVHWIEKNYDEQGQLTGNTKLEVLNDSMSIEKGYYNDGKLKYETPYYYEFVNGVQKSYYENGRVNEEATFKMNMMDGLTKTYYEDGVLSSVIVYKENEKVSEKHYDKNGNEIKLQ